MRKRTVWLGVLVAAVLLLAGCAGGNPLVGTQGAKGVAGFWAGLWHGVICPVAFVLSLFNPAVNVYEVHNTGALYNLGFVLGLGMGMGGAGRGSHKASRKEIRPL